MNPRRKYWAVFSALAVWAALPAARTLGDDLVFIHHSCGQNWLDDGLDAALTAKSYIDERNDIYYGTDFAPSTGRPDSLASVPGDNTNMDHWIRWFNDYFDRIRSQGCATGFNRIVMFKSCYPISDVASDGTEPGDPFSSSQTIANYKAVYRKYGDPGGTYANGGYNYLPLEDVFAAHPDILFIPVTAPPRHYGPSDPTTNAIAHRARVFNDWLKGEWLSSYNAAHPGLGNVAVFDWFDFLAYPDSDPSHPNRLKAEYGGTGGDSHPNSAANLASTAAFASGTGNFLDAAFASFQATTPTPPPRTPTPQPRTPTPPPRTPTPSPSPSPKRSPSPTATPSRPPTPSPAPTAIPSWPGSGGTVISGGLPAGYEPSGLSWNEEASLLFVVGDGGQVSWMDMSGGSVVTRSPGGDLEGAAIADPLSPLVYLGVENPDSIVEYNYQSRALTGKSWTLTSWMTGDSNQGLEALAFVPNGHHPYAASSSGGLFYAGLQQDGKIYVFDADLASSTSVSHVDTLTPYPGLTDISGLDYRSETGILYAIFDAYDLLLEMDPDGTIQAAYTLPAGTQEGIAVRPVCADGEAVVFVAHDDPGAVVRYQGYPVACLATPTLPPTPTPSPTPSPPPSPSRTPLPATPSPRPTPSSSPPPSSARPLFVHDSRAGWLDQTRSENLCGIFYSPYSDENGALCDRMDYRHAQVWPQWFSKPEEYGDRNFFLYVQRSTDQGWNTVAGDRIRIWYQETAGGGEKTAWLYLPGGAGLAAHCDADDVTLVYYDIDGNAYWDADLTQPAYVNGLPTPPPSPPPTPAPSPTVSPSPRRTPSPSPPPPSARPLFVHDSRAGWLDQTRSENLCGIFYSPYSDENGALCDRMDYRHAQVWPQWFNKPEEYGDRNFFLYVQRWTDQGWNTVAGDRIRIWYQETAGGEEKTAWLYLPGGAGLAAHCDADDVTLVYYDVDGNAYWDAGLTQPAWINASPSPPPTPPSPSRTPLPATPSPRPTPSSSPAAPPSPTPWRIVVGAADYDGDGADDLALFRPADGGWRVCETTSVFYGVSTDIPVPGDYDADGRADIAVFRPAEGKWWLRNPAGGSLWSAVYGRRGDIPVPADYDGDFATDTALFRPSSGQWFIRSVSSFYFGASGDAPAPGDYDGDGRAEASVWRSGEWLIRSLTRITIGSAGDFPVPGDYDGNGTCDIALFRPSSGLWQIPGVTSVNFGLSGDIPFPLDYDGDGTAERGLYRPSEGRWYLHRLTAIFFGTAADQPIAGATE